MDDDLIKKQGPSNFQVVDVPQKQETRTLEVASATRTHLSSVIFILKVSTYINSNNNKDILYV